LNNWKKLATIVTGFGLLLVVCTMTTFISLWGMYVTPVTISGVILAQIAVLILISWLGEKDSGQIPFWLFGLWILLSMAMALFFFIAVMAESLTGWTNISLIMVGIEVVATLLSFFLIYKPSK
jgi:hypothetical protein